MAENFQIRDVFNRGNILQLADNIQKNFIEFNREGFIKTLIPAIDKMTYSERKMAITKSLITVLPEDHLNTFSILIKCLPPPYQGDNISDGMDRFIVSSMTAVVAIKGIDDFENSMSTLKKMTKSFTAEWDVRPFIKNYPSKAQVLFIEWSTDNNPHVRRLVSEGSRPYLPWGMKLELVEKNPDWSLVFLENLKKDPSEYVRRSVANHLNDLSKKHPDKVVQVLSRWKKENNSKETDKLINHALRTLIKQGHTGALSLIGFSPNVNVVLKNFQLTETVEWEGTMKFTFDILSMDEKEQNILIDYAVHFKKSNGTLQPKVFKITTFKLKPQESRSISRSFSFKPITTRKYYQGNHAIEIMINGSSFAKKPFILSRKN